MAKSRPVQILLAAILATVGAARAAEPPSLLSEDMLSRFRQDATCEGRAYVSIRDALHMESEAAQSAARRQFSDAGPLAARSAADYDRAATAAAARGCAAIARALWSTILAEYEGPAHSAIRARA